MGKLDIDLDISIKPNRINGKTRHPEAIPTYIPPSRRSYFMKRTFDIIFSSIIIGIVCPFIFPLICLLIKLGSKGSIFFIQERNGLNNRIFKCIKFRTMVPNQDADRLAAADADPRITPVGKYLRITGLDELPQLLNVLRGEMSIVGPRPHMLADNQKFSLLVPGYHRRHSVKPGITGLAQAKGYKGNAGHEAALKARIKYDLLYVRNQGFYLDLEIISLTLGKMLKDTFSLIRAK